MENWLSQVVGKYTVYWVSTIIWRKLMLPSSGQASGSTEHGITFQMTISLFTVNSFFL
jgi:hypothetical protein